MSIGRRGLLQAAAGAAVATAATSAATASAQQAPAPSRAWSPAGSVRYGAALETLRAYVEQHRRDYGLPGLTLCVVDADGYTGFITSGWADVDRREPVAPGQIFEIGSISKSMVALCVFRAVQAGRLELSTDIRDALPGIVIDSPERVTLQTLLNHSSGLPDDAPLFPRATGGKLWLGYKPGSRWSYSNTGYDMLGKVVERVHGALLERILEREVFAPLGMQGARGAIREEDRPRYATGYLPYLRGTPYSRGAALAPSAWLDVTFGAGCVAATTAQMARYLRWLIDAGQGKGAPLLSDELARQWAGPTVAAPGWAPDAHYANGLAVVKVEGRTLLHHTGGMVAFSSSLHVDPQAGVACFASTNVGMTNYRPRNITAYACGLFRTAASGAKPPTPAPTALKIEHGDKLAGRFQAADGDWLELRPRADAVGLAFAGGQVDLEQADDGVFIATHPRFARYALLVESRDGKPFAIWWGDKEFASDPSHLRGPAPVELRALAGRYDNDDPWTGVARIVARPTGLFADGTTPLTRLADGSWRPGKDDWTPERIWFDAPLDGWPQRLSASGTDFLRREDRS